MTPIPDASLYDDAESDGTNDELIVVDDEDDISDMRKKILRCLLMACYSDFCPFDW